MRLPLSTGSSHDLLAIETVQMDDLEQPGALRATLLLARKNAAVAAESLGLSPRPQLGVFDPKVGQLPGLNNLSLSRTRPKTRA
jgi:hypothetical protein